MLDRKTSHNDIYAHIFCLDYPNENTTKHHVVYVVKNNADKNLMDLLGAILSVVGPH